MNVAPAALSLLAVLYVRSSSLRLAGTTFKQDLAERRPSCVVAPCRTVRTVFVAPPCWDDVQAGLS
ncbi:hypothetical protein ACO0K2_02015 [Undibacterium sp. MH2W]|uniref:hypothetical protein n=1 Tax=Undibacterium sp. MH2W TaxID=3413044 RepID=UPI003BF33114